MICKRIPFRFIALVFATLAFARMSHAQDGPGDSTAQHAYHPYWYEATVKLDRAHDSLSGVITMHAYVLAPASQIIQHAKYLSIDSVFVNGKPATVVWQDTTSGAYIVKPASVIPSPSWFDVQTYYHGPGKPEQYGTMAWGGVTDKDSMMFAMGVGFSAPYTGCTRHWLPCYDLPDDKPDSVDITFLCRDGDVTASNGLLVSNTVSNGWRTMHWHESHPIATYLLTFATGPFTEQTITNSLSIPFEVFALKRDSIEAGIQMNVRVRQILAFYDSLFSPYPFQKVGYVVTPIGSMESQTMINLDKGVLVGDSASMVKDVSSTGTVAVHELSHMWWGDRVTCKTFDDAWLNEGFATFCESLVLEHLFDRSKYLARQHTNIAGAKTSTLPLFGAATADKHTNNYPYSTIYQKGASVLGMLRQYLGDSLFFAAVRDYGNAHAYSTATSNDLRQSFEMTSGQDLGWFFKPWVFGTGYPKDTIVWSRRSDGANITFKQAVNNVATPYFRMPIPVRGSTTGGLSKTVTVWMDSTNLTTAVADFGFAPDTVIFDPDGLLIMKIVRSTMSVIAPLAFEKQHGMFTVFPNPNHQRPLEFETELPANAVRAEVIVYDVQGRIVRHLSYDTLGTLLRGTIGMDGLPSGTYRISVSCEGGFHLTYPFTLEP